MDCCVVEVNNYHWSQGDSMIAHFIFKNSHYTEQKIEPSPVYKLLISLLTSEPGLSKIYLEYFMIKAW